MDILTLILTSIGLAMDAFSVSVSSGIFIKDLKHRHALKIGGFFGFFQFAMPFIGWFLSSGFSDIIGKYTSWIAFILLGFIGGKMLFEAFSEKEEEVGNPLDNKLLLILAVATSIDALAVGVTFAAMKLPLMSMVLGDGALINSVVIGIVSFVISSCGVYIGNKCGDLFGNKAEIAGGLVLIGIGLKILLESII